MNKIEQHKWCFENCSWWLFILLFKCEMIVIEEKDAIFMIEHRGDCGVQDESLQQMKSISCVVMLSNNYYNIPSWS